MKEYQIVLVFAILFGILNLAIGQCLRDEAAALIENSTRSCRKECTVTADCSGVKTCNCDGYCGMSCFNLDAECPAIAVVNGNIAFSNERKYGSNATLTCNQGFALTGQRIRNCQSDKTWSHSNNTPNCTRGCLPPPKRKTGPISFGEDVNAVGYPVGHVLTLTCEPGYQGEDMNITCQSDFSWSDMFMICEIMICEAPGTVNHTSHTGKPYYFGSSITYSCDTGYKLEGTATFKCDAEAEWSPKDSWPTCQPQVSAYLPANVRCTPPQSPDNGAYTDGTTQEYGDVVDYSCDAGYVLNGPDQGRCNENGTWGDTPTCDDVLENTCSASATCVKDDIIRNLVNAACMESRDGKCYLPVIEPGTRVGYDLATAENVCESLGGHLANLLSQTHMIEVMKFIKRRWKRRSEAIWLRLGMKFDALANKLFFRNGTDAPGDLKWMHGRPYVGATQADFTSVALVVGPRRDWRLRYLANIPQEHRVSILCEI